MPRYAMIRVISMLLAGAGLAALAACSDDVNLGGSSPQCTTHADCAADGAADTVCIEGLCRVPAPQPDAAALDPMWGCLGKVAPVKEEPSVPVTMPFRLLDGFSMNPRAGVEVVACVSADITCTAPLPQSAATSNAEGDVDVPVFSGFRGEFKLTGDGLMPMSILALPVPDAERFASRVTWPLWRTGDFTTVAAASGGGLPNDSYAHVLFVAVDCQQNRAADVTVTPDTRSPETYGFYMDRTSNPSLSLSGTEQSGAGGYVNLPPGLRAFVARRTSGELIGEYVVPLRAGALTLAVLPPS